MTLDRKQKILITLIIIGVAFLAWEIYDIFFGNKIASAPASFTTHTLTGPALKSTPSITPPPSPSALTVPTTNVPRPEPSIMQAAVPTTPPPPRQMTIEAPLSPYQMEYINLVNQYQLTRMRRLVSDEEAAIAASRVKIAQSNQQVAQITGQGPVFRQPTTGLQTGYQLLYIDFQRGRWSATLTRNGRLYEVTIGTVLADGTQILGISQKGVVIRTRGQTYLLTFYGTRRTTIPPRITIPPRPEYYAPKFIQPVRPKPKPKPVASGEKCVLLPSQSIQRRQQVTKVSVESLPVITKVIQSHKPLGVLVASNTTGSPPPSATSPTLYSSTYSPPVNSNSHPAPPSPPIVLATKSPPPPIKATEPPPASAQKPLGVISTASPPPPEQKPLGVISTVSPPPPAQKPLGVISPAPSPPPAQKPLGVISTANATPDVVTNTAKIPNQIPKITAMNSPSRELNSVDHATNTTNTINKNSPVLVLNSGTNAATQVPPKNNLVTAKPVSEKPLIFIQPESKSNPTPPPPPPPQPRQLLDTTKMFIKEESSDKPKISTEQKPVSVQESSAEEKPAQTNSPAPKEPLKLTSEQKNTVAELESPLSTSKTSNSTLYSTDEKHLLSLPKTAYTLQLMGSYRLSDLNKFIEDHNLKDKAITFHTYYLDKDWYVLIYGIYDTDAQASKDISNLPPEVQHLNPWIRTLASVQAAIKMTPQR